MKTITKVKIKRKSLKKVITMILCGIIVIAMILPLFASIM